MLDLYRRGQGINPAVADALAAKLLDITPEGMRRTVTGLRSQAVTDALARELQANRVQRAATGVGVGGSMLMN
jgi:hypothetical protein